MICKEATERIADDRRDVSVPSNGLQMATAAKEIPQPRTSSTNVKPMPLGKSREQESRRPRFMSGRQREIAAAVVRVAALIGIAWFVMAWKGIEAPAEKYQKHAVDFSTTPLLRTQTMLPSPPRAVIPRGRLDLAIQLGAEYQPGPHEVVLVQDGMRYAYAAGSVKFENRQRILRVKLDLSRVPPGVSRLGIRSSGQDGKYYKVMLE
jgi:hypothetical protein